MKNRERTLTDLAAYGYGLAHGDHIQRLGDEPSLAQVTEPKAGRLHVRLNGNLLWSGPRIGDFLESFWFARKVAQPATEGRP